MGLWWEKIENTPPPKEAVCHPGDLGALSKSWWILWRWQQNWLHFEVLISGVKLPDGYTVYFQSGGTTMRYRKLLRSRYVALRIGAEPVWFWAVDRDGTSVPLSPTKFIFTRGVRPDVQALTEPERYEKRLISRVTEFI